MSVGNSVWECKKMLNQDCAQHSRNKSIKCAHTHIRVYLYITAISRKVHLNDKARDVSAAVNTVQLRSHGQVVEIYSVLTGANSKVA